jgi:thioredoxin 1
MKYKPRSIIVSILFALSLMVAGPRPVMAQTEAKGINFFQGSWKEAVARAKQEKKCIFLDAYAAWCGPCQTMDKIVFTDSAVADFFNRKFIAIRVDMEKGEGPDLARKFTSIDGYPSLLFFTEEGHLAKTVLGSRTAGEFLEEAKLVAK